MALDINVNVTVKFSDSLVSFLEALLKGAQFNLSTPEQAEAPVIEAPEKAEEPPAEICSDEVKPVDTDVKAENAETPAPEKTEEPKAERKARRAKAKEEKDADKQVKAATKAAKEAKMSVEPIKTEDVQTPSEAPEQEKGVSAQSAPTEQPISPAHVAKLRHPCSPMSSMSSAAAVPPEEIADATRRILDRVAELGIDIREVNKRVRAKAQELGIEYTSVSALIKVIGIDATKQIALGESV